MHRARRWLILAGTGGVGLGLLVWLASGRPAAYGGLVSVDVRPDSSPTAAYTLARVTLASESGRRVRCALRRPVSGAPGGRNQAIVLLGGIETGRRAAMLVDSSYGGVVLSCDYPFGDPSRLSIWRLLPNLPAIRRELLATPQALALAASYLLTQPGVDSTRLAGIGASLGVPFVAAWAAEDRRARAVALVYGGGDLGTVFEINLRGRVRVGWLRRFIARSAARLLGALEPTRTAGRIAPRPLLVIGAADDERIPRPSVEALFRAARGPKTLRWFGGRHMEPTETALLEAVTNATTAWLDSIVRPLPRPAGEPHLERRP